MAGARVLGQWERSHQLAVGRPASWRARNPPRHRLRHQQPPPEHPPTGMPPRWRAPCSTFTSSCTPPSWGAADGTHAGRHWPAAAVSTRLYQCLGRCRCAGRGRGEDARGKRCNLTERSRLSDTWGYTRGDTRGWLGTRSSGWRAHACGAGCRTRTLLGLRWCALACPLARSLARRAWQCCSAGLGCMQPCSAMRMRMRMQPGGRQWGEPARCG